MKITLIRPINLPAGDYTTTDDFKWSMDMTADEPTVIVDVGLAELPKDPPAADPPAGPPPPVVTPPQDPPPPVEVTPVDPPAVSSDTVTLVAKLDDGTEVNVAAGKGQRVPLVAGDRTKGSLMYYGDGLNACLENMYAGTLGDISGVFTLTAGDVVLFDGPLTLYAGAGPRPFWLTMPAVDPDADLSMFPTFGPGSEAASMYAAYVAADNSPTGRSFLIGAMGAGGEHSHLGPLPQSSAVYLTNPSAQNAIVLRGIADSARTWGGHWIDFETGKMLSVVDHPRASTLGTQRGGAGNPIAKYTTSNPNKIDDSPAHAPVFCALAAQVFNTDYDREELSLLANYFGSLWQNYAYRLPCGYAAHNHGQTRGKGRGLVVALYAAKLSDNPAYFEKWMDAIPADMEATWLGQSGIHVDQKDIPYPDSAIAPWQNHILCYGIGLALDHGRAGFQKTFDYFAENWMDSMLNTPHEFATIYEISIKDAAGNFVDNWEAAIAQLAAKSPKLAAALQYPEGSPELIAAYFKDGGGVGYQAGDFLGYPESSSGYAAMMQPFAAMVAAHATDQMRAQAAWAKFLKYRRIDSRDNPKYDVMPRAA